MSFETKFKNNSIQISAYSKNWQYGGGGKANVVNSTFESEINFSPDSRVSLDSKKVPSGRRLEKAFI